MKRSEKERKDKTNMILQVEHISKAFGEQKVLEEVTFEVAAGEVVGLLGANGAGKTTLLRIITRLLEPDSGQVLFDGHPIMQDDLRHIGYLPEERGLYRHMKAGEQALYLARLKGLSRCEAKERLHEWFNRLGMSQWWDRPAGKLSKGMQQRLQFVVTVVHSPSLVILDEPFSGFDADNAAMLTYEIQQMKAEGAAILLSTHNLQAAEVLCDRTIQLGS